MDIDAVKKILSTPLELPAADLQLRPDSDSRRGGAEIFDRLRARWVALTPEEWVRQNFTAFLIADRQWPPALMANEVAISLNNTSRRCDTVLYTPALRPLCIVEYKAPHINITQKVFDQIARYNSVLQARFLVVTNGRRHYCCRFDGDSYTFLPDIPCADMLLAEE